MKGYHSTDNLRLEIEIPATGLPNLIANHSGDSGSPYGWLTPVANTTIAATPGAPGELTFTPGATAPAHATTDFLPVVAGKQIAAQWTPTYVHPNLHTVRARFEWYNAAKVLLSSGPQTAAIDAAGVGVPAYVPALAAPASAAFVKLRFDYYNSGGINATAAVAFRWNRTMVTWADTVGEIQTQRVNLIKNPSVETNLTGWVGYSGGTLARITGSPFAGGFLARMTCNTTAESEVLIGDTASNRAAVVNGKTYTFTIRTRANTVARHVKLAFGFFNPAFAQVGAYTAPTITNEVGAWVTHSATFTSPVTGTVAVNVEFLGAGSEIHYLDAALLETGATVRPYFDGDTTASGVTYTWAGTAHASTSTEASATYAFTEPNDWRNILGPTHEISIGRAGLDVGLLSAVVLDPLLDPVVEAQMRPGKRVRVTGFDGTVWEEVFTGKITAAAVSYVPATRVTITASDAIADLAAQAEARTVATVPELAYLLEGKAVPWLVNGEGTQIASAAVVGNNPNASILDQIAITRDSALGHAYVSRKGVLHVSDGAAAALAGALTDDPADLTTTRRSYTGLDLAFGTEECVNAVTVKWLRWKANKNETTEITYGPYRDEDSIAAWGVHAAEFTVAGAVASETTAAIEAYADTILAANGAPTVGPRSLTVNVTGPGEMALALEAELAHTIEVTHNGATYTPRVTAISHSITPDRWLVTLTFADAGAVASPTIIPSPPPPATGSNAPRAGASTISISGVSVANTKTITFDPPFLTAPAVVFSFVAASAADTLRGHLDSVDVNGFTVKGQRNNNNSDIDFHWIAYPRD